jgi:hypothetical protein
MDPQATRKDLLAALQDGDEQQVSILAEALETWLQNGGYPPKTIGPWKLGLDWHVAISRLICQQARAAVATM